MHAFGVHRISNIKFQFMTAASVGRANYFSLDGILSLCGYGYAITMHFANIENEEKNRNAIHFTPNPVCVIP